MSMRSVVKCHRIRNLMVVSSLGALAVALSACSSGFQRFDRSVYNDGIPRQTAQAQNPYPGNIDQTTTASAVGADVPTPSGSVGLSAVPGATYHSPEPTYVAPNYTQPTYTQPTYTPPQPQVVAPSRQSLSNYTPTPQPQYKAPANDWRSAGNVKSSTLPRIEKQLEATKPAPKELSYTPPKPDVVAKTVHIPETPAPNTGPDTSLKTASLESTVSPRETGWTSTGGTRLTVRQGETLYNLSKRYGVPVDAIRKTNNLSSTASLQAGQSILIPTYVYGPNASISAPDNDPKTRAASAGTGYIGEVRNSRVAIPSRKPEQYAAVSSSGSVDEQANRRYQPRTIVAPPNPEKTPDYGVVTGSVSTVGGYTVQSGDSLSAIARRNGTTVSAIQRANGLTGTNIRVGQLLEIPTGIDSTTTASVKTLPPNVDPIVTGSVSRKEETSAPAISTKSPELTAPEQTGISEFRWPVKGRVIESFGESVSEGRNEGIDISVPEGTAVKAAENGVVIYAGNEISEYGNLILVRHTDGWVSAYAHNRSFEVQKGQKVNRGQTIARSGKTGNADRPKLHFELRKESKAVDPVQHLTRI